MKTLKKICLINYKKKILKILKISKINYKAKPFINKKKGILIIQLNREAFQLHQKFSEKDYKFIQLSDLENLDAVSYCYQHKKFEFISKKSTKEVCQIQGFAKISHSFRRSFNILKGTKMESQEQFIYIRAPDQKISPFLNQLLKRQNILELTAIYRNLSTFDLKNIPTTNEIKKRAEILANHIDQNKKIEEMKIQEAKQKEQELQRKEKENEIRKLTQQYQLEQEKKILEEQEKQDDQKQDQVKLEIFYKCQQEDEQKFNLIEQYYREIMDVLDDHIYNCYLKENYQQTFKLKKCKENLNEKYKKKEQDLEQTLKQLVLFKLEHSDLF